MRLWTTLSAVTEDHFIFAYTRGTMSKDQEPQSLATALAAALRQEEFILYCQEIRPITATPRIPFQEIFVRFKDEEDKLLPPGSFFPILEENGLMPLLDRWVLTKVGRWIDAKRTANPDFVIPHSSMNITRETLGDKRFPAFVQRHIERERIPAQALTFELTADTVQSGTAEARAFTEQIVKLGSTVVICDFDGSETSMEFVRLLKPDFVKLTPGLLRNLRSDSREYYSLYSLGARCKAMGIATIAERVEDRAVIDQLKTIGIDYVQGFAVGVPRPLQ